MTTKIAVFYPHNPFPPRSGSHQRALSTLAALRSLGAEVTFLSSTLFSDTEWPADSTDRFHNVADDVRVYRHGRADRYWNQLVTRYHRLRTDIPPANSAAFTPPGMKRWFAQQLSEIKPDILLINYVVWESLACLQAATGSTTVLETHDLFSLNMRMRQAVLDSLASCGNQPDENNPVLHESFFDDLHLVPDKTELRQYDKFDYVVAISQDEANLIRGSCTRAKVVLIPITPPPHDLQNTYSAPPVFAMGPNVFNVQGYHYLTQRVVPRVRQQLPGAEIQVTGNPPPGMSISEGPGTILRGFVPDLDDVYRDAGFAVCPIIGGTGQQVKIVEAMANGLAVVGLRSRAQASPIIHGENGFVADNAEEFADYVGTLARDICLRRTMGRAARETVSLNWDAAQLNNPWAVVTGAAHG